MPLFYLVFASNTKLMKINFTYKVLGFELMSSFNTLSLFW